MNLCINPQCAQSANSAQTLFCQSCGSELLLAGKYRVTKLISSKGDGGDTYEVTAGSLPKLLKVLNTDHAQANELFERELRVLNRLVGLGIKGIPVVEDLFLYSPRNSTQALNCLVMERIDGMDLEEYLKVMNRPLDEKTAIGWLSQLTQILHAIHAQGILHRDLKPAHILLQPDGQLVLINFGAVTAAATPSLGQRNRLYTPGYTAPEQQLSGAASIQSDFFALGRTFVYLLTAKNPTNIYDSYRNLLVWRNHTVNISPKFLDLIDRLMHQDPDQRPDQAATIFQAIAALTPINTAPIHPTVMPKTPLNRSSGFFIPPGKQSSYLNAPARISSPQVANSLLDLAATVESSTKRIFALLAHNWIPSIVGISILATWILWPRSPNAVTANNAIGASFTEIKDVPQGVFKYGGSTTWATTRQLQSSIDAGIKGVFPKYDIVYTDGKSAEFKSTQDGTCDRQPGSNTGICWLIAGDIDFAQSSIALDKSKYAADPHIKYLKEEAVAYDALAVVVNPQLQLLGLTIAQLRDIYTGKITNWRDLGGPNLPIVAFSRDENIGGTISSFKDFVISTTDTFKYRKVESTTAGIQQVKTTPGGIFYGAGEELIVDSCYTKPIAIGNSIGNLIKPYQEPLKSTTDCLNGQRNQINTEVVRKQEYPLTRKIYVIVKADGTDRQKAGEAYVNLLKTKQGQVLLGKAGFISIVK
jgi:serine/threonine protein kinase/ABC-type phosphate transport system substrate-binding protein